MKNLKNLLKQHHESSYDLARLLNITQASAYNYLCGKTEPNIKNLTKIADHFGVTIDFLVEHPTKAGLPINLYTEKQQEAIRLIQTLNDEQCLKLVGYIEGMLGREFIPVKQDDDQN